MMDTLIRALGGVAGGGDEGVWGERWVPYCSILW